MPWRGLRIGIPDDTDSKRRSVIDLSHSQSRHSEQLPRPSVSTSNLVPRHSESTPRTPRLTGADDDGDDNDDDDAANGDNRTSHLAVPGDRTDNNNNTGNSPASQSPGEALSGSLRRNRFSFMRLRHASDPQLSKSYAKAEQKPPPVPPLPPPPTIITTAPTSHELDQPVKRKSMFKILSASKRPSMEDLTADRQPASDAPPSRHGAQDSRDSHMENPLSTPRGSAEEPGRLSTTSARSNSREHTNDSYRSSTVTDARFSESSRSDHSQGEQGGHHLASSPNEGSLSFNKRFRLPRLKRNRNPFPLPPRPTFDRPPSTGPQPVPVPDGAPRPQTSQDGQDYSSMPSPTRSSVGFSGRPPMIRNESTNSTHSVASFSSNRKHNQAETRARSSTLDSIADDQGGNQAPPFMAPSNRTSTSTSGRKSFGDIFNLPQRLRQNSEPPAPRNGTPGTATPTKSLSYPARQESDTPAMYLSRLEECLPKGVIAGLLAQSGEEFNLTALRKCMRWFSYFGDPIDMAIRKLLMEMELPKETQQIDRFLQAFADRYHECNPGIFAHSDQAYFIAFSILILHTDVFNRNNKRKMQKPDYVKNTRGEGIADDILECYYENICYTPFIHIEDANPHGRHLIKPRRTLFKSTSSEHLGRASKEPVDPYALILDGKLDALRPSLKDVMDLDEFYSCNGTEGPPDMRSLHRAFAKTGVLQIVSARSRPDAFMPASLQNPADSNPGLVDIKVAKVGLLWRKDLKKKRGRSPWQEWGALLTFSQLYFFRDVNWVKSLISQSEEQQKEGSGRAVIFKPPLTDFSPDGLMSTDDAVALLDSNYKKHKHAFVFVRHNSLEEIFLANSDEDMNDWIAKLNYASAFRTTGVRTRGMIANGYDAQRNRMGRTDSNQSAPAGMEPPSPNPDTDVSDELVAARQQMMVQRIREANEKLFVCQKQLDDLLRNARHLQILTPVHPRAREQVLMAAGRMAAKLKWVRQDIWRTKCHREVLVRDLSEEGVDIEASAERKKSLHLQIPTAGIALRPDSGKSNQNLTVKPESPINDDTLILPDASENVDKVSLQPGLIEERRPSLRSVASGRRASADATKDQAPSSPVQTDALERKTSVLSSGSKMDVSSLNSHASKLASQASIDDNEERLLRETGLLEANGSSQGQKNGNDEKLPDGPQATPQEEQSKRTRRSLHRSLRESHHGNHIRNKKTRGSVSSSTGGGEEQGPTKEDEGLPRKTPSFNFHGKKASIVTFGSEWQNMPPEERLKLRKPTPSSSDEPRSDPTTASIADSELAGDRPQSLRSSSTATKSFRGNDDAPEALGIFKWGEKIPTENGNGDHQSTETPPRAPTLNGRLAIADGSEDVDPLEQTTQETTKASAPEQAVNA
ncbi:Arf family guanine nucleotide exchange factor SYT1 [Aspergillus glaucus CBS 516.65]|uniref:SEC7 domain-containing protein n=1 Tax=Aspergillus glaucus CBS 516.65 TaxID=1160497 RepID=A0A1L9VMG4_ASPGL|nr:hypothetical protein ASPGLDRAFT_24932 [Aspergillus glaucus CBS 516.65]OJJ85074.1 hypothetical protein ASPGLDRAFT_24932 [Aspergillus glaucus CBS 516.65]